MNHSTLGLPVHHQLPEFTQTHVHRVSDAIQPSHPLSSPSPPGPDPSQHQSFPMSQHLAWGGQSTGVSALASFLRKKSQGWSPCSCISLQSKGLSRVFSNITVQKPQFFSTQFSSQSNSHIHTISCKFQPICQILLLLLLLSSFSRVLLCVTPETSAHQAPHPWDSPAKNTGVGCHFLLACKF